MGSRVLLCETAEGRYLVFEVEFKACGLVHMRGVKVPYLTYLRFVPAAARIYRLKGKSLRDLILY